MQKKNIILFLIALFLLFTTGAFLAGRIGPGRRAAEYSERVEQLEGDLRNYGLTISGISGRSQELNREVERLNGEIDRLEREVSESSRISGEITIGLSGVDDGIGDSRQRIQEAAGGISGIEERLREIIREAEEEESDNSG